MRWDRMGWDRRDKTGRTGQEGPSRVTTGSLSLTTPTRVAVAEQLSPSVNGGPVPGVGPSQNSRTPQTPSLCPLPAPLPPFSPHPLLRMCCRARTLEGISCSRFTPHLFFFFFYVFGAFSFDCSGGLSLKSQESLFPAVQGSQMGSAISRCPSLPGPGSSSPLSHM